MSYINLIYPSCLCIVYHKKTKHMQAFFGGAKKSTIKSSPLATEALELYDAKYNKPTKQYFFETWGMPGKSALV